MFCVFFVGLLLGSDLFVIYRFGVVFGVVGLVWCLLGWFVCCFGWIGFFGCCWRVLWLFLVGLGLCFFLWAWFCGCLGCRVGRWFVWRVSWMCVFGWFVFGRLFC